MSPMFITAIIGLILTVMTLGQVTPSISEMIYAKKVEVGISREEALMQQVIRYRAIEGSYPTAVTDMVTKGYWRTTDNENGFGSGYTFTVDDTKGLIAISTTIADATKRAQYINSYRHVFKPVDMTGGVVTTTFIMPSAGSMGAPIPLTGTIPVSATAPSAASNTYWYDTSGSTAVLKVSNGSTWSATSTGSGGVAAPSSTNIVASTASLPTTATVGDVRYAYDSTTSSLSTYVYYNGGWVLSSSGSSGTSAPSVTVSNNVATQTNYATSGTACSFSDGIMGSDSLGNVYACSDPTINNGGLPTPTCAYTSRVTFDVSGDKYVCN